MSVEFKLPPIGEGVESADIAEILVSAGDTITAGQVVMELETEKAVVELPCPHAGTIGELPVSEGDTIEVGQTLFTIEVAETSAVDDADTSKQDQRREDDETSASSKAARREEPSKPQKQGAPSDQPPSQSVAPKDPAATREYEFVLPNIGEGIDSADIADIHVSVGDSVAKNDIVFDLETEKAVVELPCSEAGTVTQVLVSVGDTVKVGQQLLILEVAATSPAEATVPEELREQPADAAAAQQGAAKSVAKDETSSSTKVATKVVREPELVDSKGNGQAPVPAAPSTRRLARQLGVNLQQVDGSGPGGRITQDDVQAFVRNRLQGGVPAVSRSSGVTSLAAGSLAPPPLPDFSKFGLVEREKLSKIGRTAAENLTVSWNVIPHVTQHDRADVTELEAARKKFSTGVGANGPKVTMTAIVMKALTTCLQQFPKFNSSLDPETQEIVYKRYYHIGCAVDTPSGLLVPVVRDCDQKSIRQVAGEIGELAALARERKLPIDAMQGATCTVSNQGSIGGTSFTPIVNYPEVCILGLSRGQQELRLEDGEISERIMLPLSLSYDHRVINGADAARFLVTLCNMLSDPFQLLSAI